MTDVYKVPWKNVKNEMIVLRDCLAKEIFKEREDFYLHLLVALVGICSK